MKELAYRSKFSVSLTFGTFSRVNESLVVYTVKFLRNCKDIHLAYMLVCACISRRGLQACCSRSMAAHVMHCGYNQWAGSLARSTIKRKILVNQEIKGCFKAGSSDQEKILAIKNFDRRCR